jgi:hypothetical protein
MECVNIAATRRNVRAPRATFPFAKRGMPIARSVAQFKQRGDCGEFQESSWN